MKMKGVLLGVSVLAITAAIVGFVVWDDRQASLRQTAEARAVGLAATPVRWWDDTREEHVQGHALTFSWVDAANQPHTQTMKEITWYDPARSYKVCYNPRDASDWQLCPSDHVCGTRSDPRRRALEIGLTRSQRS